MRAFTTVLLDSFRLLKARALFWIALGISAFVALIYLSIGFDEKGITFFFGAWKIDQEFAAKGSKGAELIYLGIFSKFIVGLWLSWIAVIIAIISCAPVFPDFMAEGSAGVSLSKPLSRARLFLYKYTGALLFMGIQALLFAVIVFFAIKLRIGLWIPSVFWSVPLLLLLFSYLYSVTVLVGIKTRSVLAAVLMTMLFWLMCFLAQLAEQMTYNSGVRGMHPFEIGKLSAEEQQQWKAAHEVAKIPYLILPKTGETTALLDRWIVLREGQDLGGAAISAARKSAAGEGFDENAEKDLKRNSPWLVIGSSLAFEAAVLGLAMWMFRRRDF